MSSQSLRIPFEVAISEPKLLKRRFDQLSLPQQVALKAMYGVPLAAKADARGWTEQDYWAASQGFAEYDKLGFIARILPGAPAYRTGHEWREATAVIGVRGGKTDSFAAFLCAYEATCGGHEARIRAGKRAIVFLIAQDLRFARWALPGIQATLEAMPLIHKDQAHSKIVRTTADRIDLWNGISIAVVPPSVKAVRGYDSPAAIMDEVGVWPQEAESANPDFEIYRQIHSRQAQFTDPKIVLVSSPWVKAGLLYERAEAGTEGRNLTCTPCQQAPQAHCPACARIREPHTGRLVIHTTTAAFGNPLVTRQWLESSVAQDPKAFERECLARFVDAISGFLDPTLLQEATDLGVKERPPTPSAYYVAAIDPAFRHDAFGFAICHVEEDGRVVFDVIRRWPEVGENTNLNPLNPSDILDEIAPIIAQYRCLEIVTDQHNIDTLQQLALLRGFGLRQVTFTGRSKAEMYGNLQQLLRQRKLRLLDHEETLRELRSIERRTMPGGNVKIAAPRGAHDDMATVVALASHQAMWLAPTTTEPPPKAPTVFELCQAQIDRKRGPAPEYW